MIASLTLVVLFPAAHDCNVSTPLESGDETMAKVLLGLQWPVQNSKAHQGLRLGR